MPGNRPRAAEPVSQHRLLESIALHTALRDTSTLPAGGTAFYPSLSPSQAELTRLLNQVELTLFLPRPSKMDSAIFTRGPSPLLARSGNPLFQSFRDTQSLFPSTRLRFLLVARFVTDFECAPLWRPTTALRSATAAGHTWARRFCWSGLRPNVVRFALVARSGFSGRLAVKDERERPYRHGLDLRKRPGALRSRTQISPESRDRHCAPTTVAMAAGGDGSLASSRPRRARRYRAIR